MSKNFDMEVRAERLTRDNTFVIGGEEFAFRLDLTPEQFTDIVRDYAAMQVETVPTGRATEIVDATIRGFLYDDDHCERWDALRARSGGGEVEGAEDLAVTAYDMRQVLLWIIGEQTGRPTGAPSQSGNGRSATGPRSTEPSSSQVVASGDSESSRSRRS